MTRTFLSNLIFVLRHIYVFEREKKGSIKLVKIIKLNNCRIHGIPLKTSKKIQRKFIIVNGTRYNLTFSAHLANVKENQPV